MAGSKESHALTRRAQAAWLVAVAAIGGGAGCGSCKDDPPAATKPARTVTPAPTRPGAGLQVRKPDHLPRPVAGSGSAPTAVMTTITVEEATPVLPVIAGVSVLAAPSAAPAGGQVNLAWCIAAPDQQHALAVVKAGLTGSGWGDLHDRGQGARLAIVAEKPPYRLSASISASPRTGCTPNEGKWFASVQMYKVEAVMRPPALDDPAIKDDVVR